jgi:sulfofructosephosphate aldolase
VSATLDAVARDNGTFLMVAMDQRESLRTMLAQHHPEPGDERLRGFKLAVARELGRDASGFLIDSAYVDGVVAQRLLPSTCGLILAVDALHQARGGVVEDTDLDDAVDARRAAELGVVALKLLVIWRDDERREQRRAVARRFVELAAANGLLSVLEGVVRPAAGCEAEFDREVAIVEAAGELAGVGPSLYKCEVPLHGRGDPAEIERRSRAVDAAVGCPWVVLSQGVEPRDFPAAVEAACRGGASGMLAGRALWTAVLPDDDPTMRLRTEAAPRLRELAAIVDRFGRPWRDAL